MAIIPCNVVLLPNVALKQRFIATSQSVRSNLSLFTLNDISVHPHLSLYMLDINSRKLQIMKDAISGAILGYDQIKLQAYGWNESRGYIDMEYAARKELMSLQGSIITCLNELREPSRAQDVAHMQYVIGTKRHYFETYGYANVKEFFRPHVTITRVSTEQLPNGLTLPDKS